MIHRTQVIPLLLRACPTARGAWKDHLRIWGNEEAGLFIDVTIFVHHVMDSYKRGQMQEFPAVFEVVERLLQEGSEEVRSVAVTGFLEDLISLSYAEVFGPQAFLPWLGEASRGAWFELIDLLQCRTMIADVLHEEVSAKPHAEVVPHRPLYRYLPARVA